MDYYDILGVARDADAAELKRAFRRMARRYHPDVSSEPDAEERFKAVAEAYEVLRDEHKRASYDALGARRDSDGDFTLPPGWTGDAAEDEAGFGELFETLFGHSEGVRVEDMFGGDEQHTVEVTLEEAYCGVERTLRIKTPPGRKQRGAGSRTRSVKVQVPPRVTDGQRLRLPGEGRSGPGGRRGDLFVQVRIRPHRFFEVNARDVTLAVPVTPWEASLGATVEVPTLGGPVELRIPPGTQTGRGMRLRGRGLGHSPPGDQYVRIEVHVPSVQSDDDRALMEQMARQMAFNPRDKRFD